MDDESGDNDRDVVDGMRHYISKFTQSVIYSYHCLARVLYARLISAWEADRSTPKTPYKSCSLAE